MVKRSRQNSEKGPARQGPDEVSPQANKIGASTSYDFGAKSLTAYGGLLLVWFYNQRAGAENLIQEANNDAGLAAHPLGRWIMNGNHFQL